MLVGQQVGPFKIDKAVGSGAMGAVYRAVYTKPGKLQGRFSAIKVMAPGLGVNDKALERFQREAEILRQLNHPNIVRLYGAGRFHGNPYYAMEFLQGESLDKVLSRRGRLTWEEVVELGKQLCDGLQHAHEHGVIHRDLKPSNLMVVADGVLKLTDFGIAKALSEGTLTSANCTVGTAAYMSPEQCRGERNLTHKSDLYSMGILFYELLTGKRPFEAENAMDMFMQHVQGTFERPSRVVLDIPVWLDTLICQLMEKSPEKRPFDARTVGQSLEMVAEKVAAQQSAGVDAARARIVDRETLPNKLPSDATDKDAARSLLRGATRGKRKRKVRPFYDRVWVKALGIVVLLALSSGAIYWVMKPPTADQLYAQAKKVMDADDPNRYDQAHDIIRQFRRRFPEDARDGEMAAWEAHISAHGKLDRLENRFTLARNVGRTIEPEGKIEQEALMPIWFELFGDIDMACTLWTDVAEKESPTSELAAMARMKLAALQPKLNKEADRAEARKTLVDTKLKEAIEAKTDGRTRDVRRTCNDIVNLYHDNPSLQELVVQARELLRTLQPGGEGADKSSK